MNDKIKANCIFYKYENELDTSDISNLPEPFLLGMKGLFFVYGSSRKKIFLPELKELLDLFRQIREHLLIEIPEILIIRNQAVGKQVDDQNIRQYIRNFRKEYGIKIEEVVVDLTDHNSDVEKSKVEIPVLNYLKEIVISLPELKSVSASRPLNAKFVILGLDQDLIDQFGVMALDVRFDNTLVNIGANIGNRVFDFSIENS